MKEFANGEVINGIVGFASNVAYHPGICTSSHNLTNAIVTAIAPDGAKLRPYISVFDDGNYGIWLPLEAFSQPGLWYLVVDAPDSHFGIGIEFSQQTLVPTCLSEGDSHRRVLLRRLDPNERIVGVAFSDAGAIGDFDLQANSRGYALVSDPFPDAEQLAFIGENRHARFIGSDSLEACFDFDSGFSELAVMLYDLYWGDNTGEATQGTTDNCSGALPPCLSIGQTARVTFTDAAPLRIHSGQANPPR